MKTIIIIIIGVLALLGIFDLIQMILSNMYKKYFGGVINEENNKLDSK